jgi:hypothetical protein
MGLQWKGGLFSAREERLLNCAFRCQFYWSLVSRSDEARSFGSSLEEAQLYYFKELVSPLAILHLET